MKHLLPNLALAAALALAACGGDDDDEPATAAPTGAPTAAPSLTPAATAPVAAMVLTSTAFIEGALIPAEYSCVGKDSSPPLAWSGAPAAAKAFALLMDDPDAPRGTFDHWVVYDLPAGTNALAAGVSPGGQLPPGTKQGRTSAGTNAYKGPCPPKGSDPHRYNFRLFALDAPLGLEAGRTKAEIENAMKGHILAETKLMGRFAQ